MSSRVLLAAVLLQAVLPVHAQVPVPASRGELLYATHCIACHTKQVHWRDRRVVTDSASLTAEVARWQKNTGLEWNSEDVQEVARYLNATVYQLPDLAPRAQR